VKDNMSPWQYCLFNFEMEMKNDFYEVSKEGKRSGFTVFDNRDVPYHKETVKISVGEGGKLIFDETCQRACLVATFTMRNRYKEVLKKYEEDKNYCDEVIVSYEMSAEEIKQLGNIVKILKHKKY